MNRLIKLLIKRFIPDSENVTDKKVRERYTVLGGAVGLVCNLFLFVLKLLIGMAMNSIAVTGDAFNNLSDMGSGVVAIIAAKLSNKRPDKEHPFGHGRTEYIASLIVSFIIMLVGVELVKSSYAKLTAPEPVVFSVPLLLLLSVSLLVKLWMFSYYRYMGRRISSGVLIANSKDSINDVMATAAVIAATSLGCMTAFPVDGVIGILVSLLIIYNGFGIAKDTISLLMGKAPEPETVKEICRLVSEPEEIVGVHDLVIHDYGPGRVHASIHAEVPDNSDIVRAHEVIDRLEHSIKDGLGIDIVIHTDPISVDCERTNELRAEISEIVKAENPLFSIHDFRITDGEENINLIFDLVLTCDTTEEEKARITELLRTRVREADSRYSTVINIDFEG